jgi:hypothetical protein
MSTVVIGMLGYVLVSCAYHTRLTHGTRRKLGSEMSRIWQTHIYRQALHKSPHEVSRIRRLLLGTVAQLCGIKINHRKNRL